MRIRKLMNDLHRAHAALDSIQATLKRYYGGMLNDAALKEIRQAVSEFKAAHATAGYIGDKLDAIILMAERLYSPRKHKGDLERVHLTISTYLMNVRNSLEPKPK
jgi:hypothetical protein